MHLATIFILPHQWQLILCLADIFLFSFNKFWNCTHMCIYTKYLYSWSLKWWALYIFPSYLWALKYSLFGGLICFFFGNAYEFFTAIHKYFTFGNHTLSFTFMTTYVIFVWQTYSIFIFMPVTFEFVHTCVSIQNTNAHEVLSDRPHVFILHIYEPSSIPCLAIIFVYWKCLWIFYCNS